jgi:hypothetical protein
MVAVAVAVLAIPWASPLSFTVHAPGWHVGQSGTVHATVGRAQAQVPMSTAWATNVHYRDSATSDPPNTTLQHLSPTGVVVWASIQPSAGWPPDGRRTTKRYSLADSYRFACCEGEYVGGGERELYGFGPGRAYSVLVRIYFGSGPTNAMKVAAQRVLHSLRLPRPRS